MADQENHSLNENVKVEILKLLEGKSKKKAIRIFTNLHPANQADLIAAISSDAREKLLLAVGANIDAQFLSYLESAIKNEVIEFLGAKNSAKAIDKLEIDDAIEIIEDLEDEGIDEILNHISQDKRTEIEEALAYGENSVGRVMHQDFVAIRKNWTVGQATHHLQQQEDLPDDFQYVIVVDDNYRPLSQLPVSKILVSRKNTNISDISPEDFEIKRISVESDQEDAARLFSKYSLTYAAVVDKNGILVGAISVGDVVDIIEEEAQEDLLLLGGVNDSNLYSSSFLTAKSRILWLFISLMTTSLASLIIVFFSGEIQKAVMLAALLPIIASLAGNAGTQALTVLVRSIATNEISNIGALKVLLKEMCVGSLNGLFLALIATAAYYFLKHDLNLSLILGATIFFTVFLAGFFGAFIPIFLSKMKFDPAISSGVFLIAITDTSSFLIFLGLAAIFII